MRGREKGKQRSRGHIGEKMEERGCREEMLGHVSNRVEGTGSSCHSGPTPELGLETEPQQILPTPCPHTLFQDDAPPLNAANLNATLKDTIPRNMMFLFLCLERDEI